VCMHVTAHGWGSHHTSHTRRHKVTQSRGNRGPDLYLHLAGVIPNSGFFHTRSYFDKKIFWLGSRDVKTFPNAPYKRSTTTVVLPYNAGKWLSFCTHKRHRGDIDSDTLCGKSSRHCNPGCLPGLHPPSKWYSRALLAGSPDTQDRRV